MLDLKPLLHYFCLILSVSLFNGAVNAHAQSLRAIYDGRGGAGISQASEADVQLIKRDALPKARQLWRNNEACREGFEVVDVATGSFTKPKAAQRAVLYRFCVTGHNFAHNGIAIIEDGSIVAHVLYEGGEDSSIKAIADIDNNGLSEIVRGNGATNQGYTILVAILIEISPSGVKKLGIADVYEDDCGAKEPCTTNAYKISAKPGRAPVFYREAYRGRGKSWIKAGATARYSLRKDESSYQLVN
jgi:hypothetical protein